MLIQEINIDSTTIVNTCIPSKTSPILSFSTKPSIAFLYTYIFSYFSNVFFGHLYTDRINMPIGMTNSD